MLTAKQRELLLFITERIRETGVCPSFEEMKGAVGLKAKSGIHRLICGLEERGFIRRLPVLARSIEVLRAPEDVVPATVLNLPEVSPGSAGKKRFMSALADAIERSGVTDVRLVVSALRKGGLGKVDASDAKAA